MAVAFWAVVDAVFGDVRKNAARGEDYLEKEADDPSASLSRVTTGRADVECGQIRRVSAAAVLVPLALPKKGPQSNLQTSKRICLETPDGPPCSTEACPLQILPGASVRKRDVANCLHARTDRKLELAQRALYETHAAQCSRSNRVETPFLAGALHHRRSLPGECGSACDANCAQSNALDPLRPE